MSWATAPKRPPRTARKYMPFFGRRAVHITRRSAMRRVGFSATTASRSRSTRRREPMEPSTIITLQDQRARYAVRLHHLPVGYASTAGPRLGTLLRRNRLLVIVKVCGGNGSGAFGDRAGRISGLKGGAMFPGGVLLLEGFAHRVLADDGLAACHSLHAGVQPLCADVRRAPRTPSCPSSTSAPVAQSRELWARAATPER